MAAELVFGNKIPFSDIYIQDINIRIVYENWRVLAINREINTRSAICSKHACLMLRLRKCKNQRNLR